MSSVASPAVTNPAAGPKGSAADFLSVHAVASRLASGERIRSSADDLALTWAEFLGRFNMQWFCTFTFREGTHPEAADKKWRVWVSKLNRRLYGPRWHRHAFKQVFWIRALEWQKRDVLHYHALVGDHDDLNNRVRRLTMMDEWFSLAGIARIDPIQPGEESEHAVRAYVSKYVAKGGELDLSPSLRWYLQPMREIVLR